jgi:hypothetical protein
VISKLPKLRLFSHSLSRERTAILGTELFSAFQAAKALGGSVVSVARLRAAATSAASAVGEECVIQAAPNPSQTIRELQSGVYDLDSSVVPHDCAKTYIRSYYAVVETRELARVFECLEGKRKK